jgi:hypothetical protein
LPKAKLIQIIRKQISSSRQDLLQKKNIVHVKMQKKSLAEKQLDTRGLMMLAM